MSKALCQSVVMVLFVAGVAFAQGTGQPPPAYTAIQVEKMHCEGCAKRIGGKIQEVPGVAKIQYDVSKKIFWVHPQDGKQLSPKLLWEAVEKGDDRPIQLYGPSGQFTKKPKA